jgi:hypothetical protein
MPCPYEHIIAVSSNPAPYSGGEAKVVPVFNTSNSAPWKHTEEWIYCTIIFEVEIPWIDPARTQEVLRSKPGQNAVNGNKRFITVFFDTFKQILSH